jgi:hypothetical protein
MQRPLGGVLLPLAMLSPAVARAQAWITPDSVVRTAYGRLEALSVQLGVSHDRITPLRRAAVVFPGTTALAAAGVLSCGRVRTCGFSIAEEGRLLDLEPVEGLAAGDTMNVFLQLGVEASAPLGPLPIAVRLTFADSSTVTDTVQLRIVAPRVPRYRYAILAGIAVLFAVGVVAARRRERA